MTRLTGKRSALIRYLRSENIVVMVEPLDVCTPFLECSQLTLSECRVLQLV